MKKAVILTILGLGTATNAFAQGHILVSNYVNPPYAQVYCCDLPMYGAKANKAVTAAAGLTFQLFYGAGVQTSYDALTPGVTFQITDIPFDPGMGHGPGGYFINVHQEFPDWQPGDVYTLGYRVINLWSACPGRSALWYESANIVPITQAPLDSQSIGLIVGIPEPGSFAVAALGATAWFTFGRRRRESC